MKRGDSDGRRAEDQGTKILVKSKRTLKEIDLPRLRVWIAKSGAFSIRLLSSTEGLLFFIWNSQQSYRT